MVQCTGPLWGVLPWPGGPAGIAEYAWYRGTHAHHAVQSWPLACPGGFWPRSNPSWVLGLSAMQSGESWALIPVCHQLVVGPSLFPHLRPLQLPPLSSDGLIPPALSQWNWFQKAPISPQPRQTRGVQEPREPPRCGLVWTPPLCSAGGQLRRSTLPSPPHHIPPRPAGC
jgi:hypothetical protein